MQFAFSLKGISTTLGACRARMATGAGQSIGMYAREAGLIRGRIAAVLVVNSCIVREGSR
jgi:hypothetical protein